MRHLFRDIMFQTLCVAFLFLWFWDAFSCVFRGWPDMLNGPKSNSLWYMRDYVAKNVFMQFYHARQVGVAVLPDPEGLTSSQLPARPDLSLKHLGIRIENCKSHTSRAVLLVVPLNDRESYWIFQCQM